MATTTSFMARRRIGMMPRMHAKERAEILQSFLVNKPEMLLVVSCLMDGLEWQTNGKRESGRPHWKKMRHTVPGEMENQITWEMGKTAQCKTATNYGMISAVEVNNHSSVNSNQVRKLGSLKPVWKLLFWSKVTWLNFHQIHATWPCIHGLLAIFVWYQDLSAWHCQNQFPKPSC